MKKSFLFATSLLALSSCTCAADSCKTSKITLGMTQAQVRDICGCGEPTSLVDIVTNGKKHLELTYGSAPIYNTWSINGEMVNGYHSSTVPSEHCSDLDPLVTLDDDHVTAIRTGRSCRRY